MKLQKLQRRGIPALKPKARKLDPADVELFRRSMADVTPLAPRNQVRREKPPSRPRTGRLRERQSEADALSDHAPYTHERGNPVVFNRPGVQRQVLRRLARNAAVQAELDLHGLTVAAARPVLVSFLSACARKGFRRVRIIHGKGLRSAAGEGVLKRMVASWLAQWPDVLAFREAGAREGGSGAVVVLLRGRTEE